MPSPPCDDATFLRRVTVDLCGRLPTRRRSRGRSWPTRRPTSGRKLIDRLLDSPDYPAYFAMHWGTILRNSQLAGADQAAYAFHNWIKDIDRPQPALRRVRPRHRRGRRRVAGRAGDQLVLAEPRRPAAPGHGRRRPGVPRHAAAVCPLPPPSVRALGPGGLLRPGRLLHAAGPQELRRAAAVLRLAQRATTGEKNPLTGKTPEPKFLDGDYAKFTPEEDPRHALVDWMAKPDNPFFAKALVNRMWGHFFGRGLVHEVDDLRETNPPSNPELLDALAKDFVEHKFDVKHVIRTHRQQPGLSALVASRREHNEHDRQNFARFYARRLIAEVFLDAVDQATGTQDALQRRRRQQPGPSTCRTRGSARTSSTRSTGRGA